MSFVFRVHHCDSHSDTERWLSPLTTRIIEAQCLRRHKGEQDRNWAVLIGRPLHLSISWGRNPRSHQGFRWVCFPVSSRFRPQQVTTFQQETWTNTECFITSVSSAWLVSLAADVRPDKLLPYLCSSCGCTPTPQDDYKKLLILAFLHFCCWVEIKTNRFSLAGPETRVALNEAGGERLRFTEQMVE